MSVLVLLDSFLKSLKKASLFPEMDALKVYVHFPPFQVPFSTHSLSPYLGTGTCWDIAHSLALFSHSRGHASEVRMCSLSAVTVTWLHAIFPTSVSQVAFKCTIFFVASEQVTPKSLFPPSPRSHHKERMLSRFCVISHMLISRVRLRYGPNNDHSSRLAAQMGTRLACADQQPKESVQFHVPESFLDLSHTILHPRCFCLNSPASFWRSDLCDTM